MRPGRIHNGDETFERMRERMLEETSRFIEWGLKNPEKVQRIPRHPVGYGGFSNRMKVVFWSLAVNNKELPE
jgi:hypothetical protein